MKQKIHIPHSLIDKLPHWLIFFFLCSFFSNAQQTQPYEWQWAISGGASLGGTGTINPNYEQIFDIKVGTDSNYYFIATLAGPFNANLNGEEVPSYNNPNTALGNFNNDIFLFSTDCEGQVRWSQTIGGWRDDSAYNLVLDSLNNVYVGANVGVNTNTSGPGVRRPLHFTENDSIPFANTAGGGGQIPQEGFKTTYLVKYKSNGDLDKKVALQGDVTNVPSEFQSLISDLAIDSEGKIHFIVGLLQGTHLDGQVTVPSSFNDLNSPQFYLAVYNPDLTYHSSMLLDMSGHFFYPRVRFAYDENTNQYYIAGLSSPGITGTTYPLSFDGNPTENRSFILAFDDSDGSENWRREIYADNGQFSSPAANTITSLIVDESSNVYIGGKIFRLYDDNTVKVYDPTGSYTYPIAFTSSTFISNIPFVTKFGSNGAVEWVKMPTDFAPGWQDNSSQADRGLAINGDEVAFGRSEAAFEWDGLYIPNLTPNQYRGDPTLLRLNKNTGAAVGLHTLPGTDYQYEYITAIAVDNDGNYIVGGSFPANLLLNNNLGLDPLYTTGESDFFVAKLANSVCGSGLSTADFNALSFNVYPNPTTDIVTIETDEKLAATYQIFNESAQLVYGKGQKINDGMYQINLEGMASGLYFILIKTETGRTATLKVVKE